MFGRVQRTRAERQARPAARGAGGEREHGVELGAVGPVRMYEGALLFITGIF